MSPNEKTPKTADICFYDVRGNAVSSPKKISFYPEPDIATWYDSLPRYKGSEIINAMLRHGLDAVRSAEIQAALLRKDVSEVTSIPYRHEPPVLSEADELADQRRRVELIEKTDEDKSRAIVELAAINLTVIQLLQANFENAGGHSKDIVVLKDLESRANKLLTFDM
jgi:hypothetical protein